MQTIKQLRGENELSKKSRDTIVSDRWVVRSIAGSSVSFPISTVLQLITTLLYLQDDDSAPSYPLTLAHHWLSLPQIIILSTYEFKETAHPPPQARFPAARYRD